MRAASQEIRGEIVSEKENIARVVGALKKVPEKRLLLIDLANQLCLPNGDLDIDQLVARQPEVNLAVVEAKAYGNATVKALNALKFPPCPCQGESMKRVIRWNKSGTG